MSCKSCDKRRNDFGYPNHIVDANEKVKMPKWGIILIATALLLLVAMAIARASDFSDIEIANAIYLAEGGAKTKHPYGILTKYKHTTPRQACLNTIRSAKHRYAKNNQRLDFITFLGKTYCPVGAKNDPTNLNVNWVKNVKYFLAKSKGSQK